MANAMERWAALRLNSTSLPPGMRVGMWELRDWRGHGTYGTVYSAVRVGDEEAGLVALKMAAHPGDARFVREVELLSRIDHPNVPSLLGHGHWRSPSGASYPYFVMEWVEGLPLYTWASVLNPSAKEVRRVLAQVARALEATHFVGGVHRDVKGSNVLVRLADGRAFLTDFGAGHYAGAIPLTRETLPPGTPVYRSPEARRFARHFHGQAVAPYVAQPADDVFALGVTAYRLVTREYPPSRDCDEEVSEGCGQEEGSDSRSWHSLKLSVEPQLKALILRILSVKPKDRRTARELAEVLEQTAEQAQTESVTKRPCLRDLELENIAAPSDAASWDESKRPAEAGGMRRAYIRSMGLCAREAISRWADSLGLGLLGGFVMLLVASWPLWQMRERTGLMRPQPISGEETADGGTAAMGNSMITSAIVTPYAPSGQEIIGLPMPKDPLQGQRKAPQCKLPLEESINGGCWIRLGNVKSPCAENGYEWKGHCYLPSYSRLPQPTSEKE
ncbi:serine/threonine protein kinase [Hyalangium rubrum]|uniref:Serine/threonine-protein kinase n=1 Tax=Hyalangium rubrum TaxID=3103134 RepID=A0ABU5H3V7_9BACT|nr:serine/threonine-protein kinase [Hyalangium sp. s54d21]MDY7228138.1 serine/threonine-protein kinase [Hyalangium sp. s54d21]